MLNNIKSLYFHKLLFSYIEEKIKLEIIKCNKGLQQNIDISLINYKVFSGRYVIKESEGLYKEYNGEDRLLLSNNNKIVYIGGYLNGQRNGNGKEYDDEGKLLFEGEYIKGKRHGKGKEYDEKKHLRFEGEYLNGKKWNGKGYNRKGINKYTLINGNGFIKLDAFNEKDYFIFEGEYLNGEKNGIWKEYLGKNLTFEGEYKKGKRNGKGKEYSMNNFVKFDGEYFNDKRWNGNGYDKNGNIVYTLKNGQDM